MKQEEDKWLKALRENMEDYSITPKADGWDRLEKALPATTVVPRRSYYMYSAVAAIALLLIVSSTAIYFLGDKTAKYTQTAQLPADIKSAINEHPLKTLTEPLVKESKTISKLAMNSSLVKSPKTTIINDELVTEEKKENTQVEKVIQESKEDSPIKQEAKEKETTKKFVSKQMSLDLEPATETQVRTRRKGARNWSVGLTAGNSSGFSTAESNAVLFSNPRMKYISPLLTSSEATDLFTTPEMKLNHKLPITFGASIRKQISDHIAIQSGIMYTRLESELLNGNSSYATYEQTLHYIGIPLKMDYLFYSNRFLTLYLSGGGAVEKSVSGQTKTVEHIEGNSIKENTSKLNVKPLQWSVGGAVGVQLNINKQFGVFAEPGATYFFKDGSDVQTIRKETPFNFNLQLGVRICY